MIKIKEDSRKILSYRPEMIVQACPSPIPLGPKEKKPGTYAAYKLLSSYSSKYKDNLDYFLNRPDYNSHNSSGPTAFVPHYFKLVPSKRIESFKFYRQDKKHIYFMSEKLQSIMIFDKPSSKKAIVPNNYFDLFDSPAEEVKEQIEKFGFFPLKVLGSNSLIPFPYDEDSIEDLIGDIMKLKSYIEFDDLQIGKMYITSNFSNYHRPKILVDKDESSGEVIYVSFLTTTGISKNYEKACFNIENRCKLELEKDKDVYTPEIISELQFNSNYRKSTPEKVKMFKEVEFQDQSLLEDICMKTVNAYKDAYKKYGKLQ
jgi:hypothetical protein